MTDEELPSPIIGRRLLELLGCDNRDMFWAARDKFSEDIVVADRLVREGNEKKAEGK